MRLSLWGFGASNFFPAVRFSPKFYARTCHNSGHFHNDVNPRIFFDNTIALLDNLTTLAYLKNGFSMTLRMLHNTPSAGRIDAV